MAGAELLTVSSRGVNALARRSEPPSCLALGMMATRSTRAPLVGPSPAAPSPSPVSVLLPFSCSSSSSSSSSSRLADEPRHRLFLQLLLLGGAIGLQQGYQHTQPKAVRMETTTGGKRDYGDTSYWDESYRGERKARPNFEWLAEPRELQAFLRAVLGDCQRVLHLGSGMSSLPEAMFDNGFGREACCVDSSPTCLASKEEANRQTRPGLHWVLADCREMSKEIGNNSWPAAIDKSTLDAIHHNDREEDALRYLAEVARVLEKNGLFIVFSWAPAPARVPMLERFFAVEHVETIVSWRGVPCYAYICRKTK